MRSGAAILSLLCCSVILLSLKTFSRVAERYVEEYPQRLIRGGAHLQSSPQKKFHSDVREEKEEAKTLPSDTPISGKFTVIIVTFNEVLLEKTYGFYSC